MRCVIARFPFDLSKSGVLASMKGVRPEPITGDSVIIGRRHYPVMQVGEVIRAVSRLGFTCRSQPVATPARALSPFEEASALLGTSPAV